MYLLVVHICKQIKEQILIRLAFSDVLMQSCDYWFAVLRLTMGLHVLRCCQQLFNNEKAAGSVKQVAHGLPSLIS